MSTADTTAIVSTGAAAVAAFASWASVWQSSRTQRRALEPRLHIQAAKALGSPTTRIRVANTGGGFASEVFFWLKDGPNVALGGLPPHGSLGPGEAVTLETDLPDDPNNRFVEALVWWRYGRRMYAQAAAPSYRKDWSRRRWAFWAPRSHNDIPRRFFKDAGSIDEWTLYVAQLVDGPTK